MMTPPPSGPLTAARPPTPTIQPVAQRGFGGRLRVVGVVAIAAIAVVTWGGGGNASDPIGDVRLVRGKQPRDARSLPIAGAVADISGASVSSQGSTVVFEVTTATDIPTDFARSSLEFRFDISESGRPTWIATGSVNVSATAALVAQTSDYTATTIDGSFPGEVDIAGRTLTITLDRSGIEGFPGSFEWALTSNVIAFRDVTGSTRAEDRFPDEGTKRHEP